MSTLRVDTLQTAAGVQVYTARAWVNFNGTGTVAIRAAGNVSSITDNGVGDYTVNFTNAMADANYCVCGTSAAVSGSQGVAMQPDWSAAPTTSAVRVRTQSSASTIDPVYAHIAIFR